MVLLGFDRSSARYYVQLLYIDSCYINIGAAAIDNITIILSGGLTVAVNKSLFPALSGEVAFRVRLLPLVPS